MRFVCECGRREEERESRPFNSLPYSVSLSLSPAMVFSPNTHIPILHIKNTWTETVFSIYRKVSLRGKKKKTKALAVNLCLFVRCSKLPNERGQSFVLLHLSPKRVHVSCGWFDSLSPFIFSEKIS